MLKRNMHTIVLIICIVISAVINLSVYDSLPNRIGLHIDASGDVSNYVSKQFFVLFTPIILLLNLVYILFMKDEKGIRAIFGGVILFVVNLIIIFINIR